MKNIYAKYLLLWVSLVYFQYSYAQFDIRSFSSTIENSHDLFPFIVNSSKLRESKGFTFYGLGQNLDENVITTGIDLATNRNIKIIIPPEIEFDPNLPLIFYINFFSHNIDTLIVNIKASDGFSNNLVLKIPNEGYIKPIEIPVFTDEMTGLTVYPKIEDISISIESEEKNIDLIIAECKLYQRRNHFKMAKAEFFYEFTSESKYKPDLYEINDFGDSFNIKRLSSYINFGSPEFRISYDSTLNQTEREDLFFSLISHVFKRYPYYKDHQLDSLQLSNELTTIKNSTLEYAMKLQNLQSLIKKFHDGHFNLELHLKKEKLTNPLYAYRKDSSLFIAAVFADTLKSVLYPGISIKSINNISANEYLDSLANLEYGNLNLRKNLAVSRLFSLNKRESILLETVDSLQNTKKVIISGSFKTTIPNSFRPKHFDFYVTDNQWGYLKINSWNNGDWIKFLNLSTKLNALQGIIFDLRGNPGGVELEILRVASCFISEPVSYSHLFYDNLVASESNILLPNRFINLKHLKVQILVDHRTACASEQFIYIMKKFNSNTIVIGAKTTAGSYSNASFFLFPEEITLCTNVMQKSCLDKTRASLEYQGITPDIIVPIDSYNDLYGYNDKVLITAIERKTE